MNKQEKSKQEKQRPWSREERHYRRHKGTVRCSWCGRWTEVRPGKSWTDTTWEKWRDEARRHEGKLKCERPRCVASRY